MDAVRSRFHPVLIQAPVAVSCCGSACSPVTVPVFKTGGWQAILSPVGSTPTRFRQFFTHKHSAL